MDNNNEKIGYGNPPKETRFAKGKSGNPKGRPKGSRNTYKLLDDILEQKITMMQEGKPIRISKKMAILLQAVNSAVKGDLKAIQNLFPHLLAVDANLEDKEQKISSLKQDDMEILNQFFNHKEKNNEI